MKKITVLIISLAILYLLFTIIAPPMVEKSQNQTQHLPPYHVSAVAKQIYGSLDFVADLHTDSLLWDRNLLKKAKFGHVDIPRLREANVALQAFTIVTKSPKGLNMQKNSADARDDITLLSIGQGQPISTWFSLFERALYQTKKLHTLAEKDENFIVIKNSFDLQEYIAKRKNNPELTAGFLGVEGAHALEGKLDNVDALFQAGGQNDGRNPFL